MTCVNKVTWSTADLVYGRPPVSEARLLLWEQWVGDCFDTSVDESLEDLGAHSRDIGR